MTGRCATNTKTSLVAETDESILLFSEPGLPYWHERKAAWFEAPDGLIEIYFKHQWYNVFYRRIKAELRVKGKMIPDNDIWIAATAFQYDLILATRDGHFQHINGLRIEAW